MARNPLSIRLRPRNTGLLGLSSSKLSSERSVPRVCPAINASHANPREQITGGRQEGRGEEASDRVAARTWNCFVKRPETLPKGQLDDRETVSWDPRDERTSEGRGSLAFRRVLLLHLVRCGESRVQFPNSGFQGISRGLFRESYHPRSILPIFLSSKLVWRNRSILFSKNRGDII